jgi:hypothetical protein
MLLCAPERNWYAAKFIQAYKDELTPQSHVFNWKDIDNDEFFAFALSTAYEDTPNVNNKFIHQKKNYFLHTNFL